MTTITKPLPDRTVVGDFEYEVMIQLWLPRGHAELLRRIALAHYDAEVRESAKCGPINGLRNIALFAEDDGETIPTRMRRRDLDTALKAMEQISWSADELQTVLEICSALTEAISRIDVRRRQLDVDDAARPPMIVTPITYCGQPAVHACDVRCEKAWGSNSRPRVAMSSNVDDWAYLSDAELGRAPADPGTSEGGDYKPRSVTDPAHVNRWCVRECERARLLRPGERVDLRDFSTRVYNIAPHKRES